MEDPADYVKEKYLRENKNAWNMGGYKFRTPDNVFYVQSHDPYLSGSILHMDRTEVWVYFIRYEIYFVNKKVYNAETSDSWPCWRPGIDFLLPEIQKQVLKTAM